MSRATLTPFVEGGRTPLSRERIEGGRMPFIDGGRTPFVEGGRVPFVEGGGCLLRGEAMGHVLRKGEGCSLREETVR